MAVAEKTTTIRMDRRTLGRIDELADALNRSRSWVVKAALDRYLDYEEWFVSGVKHALKEVEAGNVTAHEAVVKMWERKRADKLGRRRAK